MSAGSYYPVFCDVCGWSGMSNEAGGGDQIADTGDYDDIYCPVCGTHDGSGFGEWPSIDTAPTDGAKP